MKQETVEQIFRAAVEIFAESGFERAKMDDIAQRAQVAKGTIYYHFKGKEELFVALMNSGMEKFTDVVRRATEAHQDPADQLRGLLRAKVTYLYHHGTFAKLLLSEVWGSKERQQAFRARIRDLVELIEGVLRRGGDSRFTSSRDRLHETAVAIFGAISVTVLQEIFRAEDRELLEGDRIEVMLDTLEPLICGALRD
ncbi:hypothetical protein GCM10011571_04270 [Marinithermofilum abyssi]|uniref:HTH tetR-type domain-containing protein n=1 Tax=Marinithermofilum abyssi TaxID=1571185 RepID=A0A8J2VE69_9BACL|nr:TetR/AcrR family transcriptional regulator [Marinithermofilum abyssi]GGE06305.1 hypothetical protein GCM10011571_04270 [Marinithermofilum abyssi]